MLLVGAPRTGKTTWPKRALRYVLDGRRTAGCRSRLVIFDPMNEYHPTGATRVRTRKDYLVALRAERFPLVVVRLFSDWHPLEEMRDVVLVADEAHNYCSPSTIDRSLVKLYCEGGGHYNTDLLFASQRPRRLNLLSRSNATWCFALPLQTKSDRLAVEEDVGMDLPDSPAGGERDRAGFYIPLCWRAGRGMVPPSFS